MVALFDTLMNNKMSIHENMHVHEYFQRLPTTTTALETTWYLF